ncbi:succinyl-CoA ligase-like flavodoxin domain protein, partial [Bordetella bronchiseptica E014]
MMNPASVAVVGASEDRRKFGGRILHLLNNQGFRGRILPVNPVRAEILGHQAYRCIMDLPQAPDLVILAIPRDLVVQAVSDCGDIGAKGVIVVASGFSESGDEGARLEQQLLAVAREKAVRIIGPNCVGVVSPAHGFSLATTVSLVDRAPVPGHIGLISQSGAVMGTMIDRGISQNVGFSHCISVGNQADVDFCDFVDFMIDDPGTHVICTYVEGIKRPDLFLRAAGRAQAANKPWLLMKSGRTEAGAASAFSH